MPKDRFKGKGNVTVRAIGLLLLLAGFVLVAMGLLGTLLELEDPEGPTEEELVTAFVLVALLLGSCSILVGLSLVCDSGSYPDGWGGRSIWKDQPRKWEKARAAFQEHLAKKRLDANKYPSQPTGPGPRGVGPQSGRVL